MSVSISPLALYIHWPFCKIKCPYCDFNSYRRENVNQSDWIKAYLKGLEFWSSRLDKRQITSIFFGGGTPSLLKPSYLDLLLKKIENLWGINSDCEITVAANPNSVSSNKFKNLHDIGINRVSVGIQALNNYDLENLGRDHNKSQAMKAIEIVNKCFENYNLDFIYGRQFQEIIEWENELTQIILLKAPHLSLYQLTIEENTNFFKLFKNGLLKGIPTSEEASEMFYITKRLCEKGGYKQYETSNFAKKNFECRLNLSYWKYNDYIGIGPGAHGRIKIFGKKYATLEERNPDIWFKKTVSLKSETPKLTQLNNRITFEEKLIMNLRISENIPIDIFDKKKLNPVLMELVDNNLIKIEGNQIIIKENGKRMLDYITRSLLDCY